MNEFSTYFWIAKAKKNARNLCPIYCRITINGKRTEKSTKVYVLETEWNNKQQKITSKANEHLNDKLFNFRVQVEKRLIKIEKKAGTISIRDFKKKEMPIPTLLDMYQSYIGYRKNDALTIETEKSIAASFKVFERFVNKKQLRHLLITEVNVAVADSFCVFLKTEQMTNANAKNKVGYSPDVIRKALRRLQIVVEYAYNTEIIASNPLAFYKPKIKQEKKPLVFLEVSEIARLANHQFAAPRLQEVADLFVFQCYTGFAYNEVMSFDYAKDTKIWNNRRFIEKARGKTGIECLLPFFPEAARIYQKYGSLPKITNQKYNAYLKEVAEIIGLGKRITTHVARKTAAMLFYESGASEQVVAKMLGHATAKTTFNFYATVREGAMQEMSC